MLTKCPECDLPVSTKATTCPHCGYPLKSSKSQGRSSPKHMRLPNGFGSITRMNKPNLRNPYRVRVCTGKASTGRPIMTSLKPKAYFKTYNEAYTALVEYNQNPYDLSPGLTVTELYKQWTEKYFQNIKQSSQRSITSAWSYCSSVYDMRVSDLRARHIKGCMDNGCITIQTGSAKGQKRYASAGTKERIKSMFNLLLDYAMEYEIVTTNYARTFDISADVLIEKEKMKNSHIAFTESELDTLWKNREVPYVDAILIQCYMGWRPQELCLIEKKNVNLENWTIAGGMKTKYGTDRLVPIHPGIRKLIENRYAEAKKIGSDYLFNATDAATHRDSYKLTYDKYKYRFAHIVESLGLNPNHKPHDPRKTFVTLAKKYKVDDFAIKRIVGHSLREDITESVYTERSLEWLQTEIAKISIPGCQMQVVK